MLSLPPQQFYAQKLAVAEAAGKIVNGVSFLSAVNVNQTNGIEVALEIW